MHRAIIFANGQVHNGSAVEHALSVQSALIIAADGGAEWALKFERQPDVVIGDMDSVRPETLEALRAKGCEIVTFPPEKDETDLELALLEAVKRGASWIRVIGAIGGRADQMLANIYLLTLPQLRGLDVRLVDEEQTTWLLRPGEHDLIGEEEDTVSLLPLSAEVSGITTTGLYYPLNHENLVFGPARGVSNAISQPPARIRLEDGILLAVHTVGRA